jgi:hypothetical protein
MHRAAARPFPASLLPLTHSRASFAGERFVAKGHFANPRPSGSKRDPNVGNIEEISSLARIRVNPDRYPGPAAHAFSLSEGPWPSGRKFNMVRTYDEATIAIREQSGTCN